MRLVIPDTEGTPAFRLVEIDSHASRHTELFSVGAVVLLVSALVVAEQGSNLSTFAVRFHSRLYAIPLEPLITTVAFLFAGLATVYWNWPIPMKAAKH